MADFSNEKPYQRGFSLPRKKTETRVRNVEEGKVRRRIEEIEEQRRLAAELDSFA